MKAKTMGRLEVKPSKIKFYGFQLTITNLTISNKYYSTF